MSVENSRNSENEELAILTWNTVWIRLGRGTFSENHRHSEIKNLITEGQRKIMGKFRKNPDKTYIAEGVLDFVDVAEFFVDAIIARCSDLDEVAEDNRVR